MNAQVTRHCVCRFRHAAEQIMRAALAAAAMLAAMSLPVRAGNEMLYLYNGPETPGDHRYDYEWDILRAALDRTIQKYGPYKMLPSKPLTETQQLTEILAGRGKLNMLFRGDIPEVRSRLIPIPIPVDKNLQGFNVLLTTKKNLDRLRQIKSLEELRKIRIGLGMGWIDVDILLSNGLQVVTAEKYSDLFRMVATGQSDAALRSAVEVLGELEYWQKVYPDLRIEEQSIVYYPMPMYFWFAKSPEGRKLAARVEEGMWQMVNDGTYDRIFEQHQGRKIAALGLDQRRPIRIGNPYFSRPAPPYDDQRLWLGLDVGR